MNLQEFSFPVGTYYFEKPWSLDNVTYILTLRFNLRIGTWTLDIADVTGANILCGVALRTNRDLLKQYVSLPLPQGLLFVYDATGNAADPGKDDFNLSHSLLYLSSGT